MVGSRLINSMFKVFTHSKVIDDVQFSKEIAKPTALHDLETRMKSEHAKTTDPWYRSRINVDDAQKNYKEAKRNYERVCPETLSPQTKDRLWLRAKELKDKFTVGMLSRQELHPTRTVTRADNTVVHVIDETKMNESNSVHRESAWNKNNNDIVREFKNIMRKLCPENPNAGDIEKFRPK